MLQSVFIIQVIPTRFHTTMSSSCLLQNGTAGRCPAESPLREPVGYRWLWAILWWWCWGWGRGVTLGGCERGTWWLGGMGTMGRMGAWGWPLWSRGWPTKTCREPPKLIPGWPIAPAATTTSSCRWSQPQPKVFELGLQQQRPIWMGEQGWEMGPWMEWIMEVMEQQGVAWTMEIHKCPEKSTVGQAQENSRGAVCEGRIPRLWWKLLAVPCFNFVVCSWGLDRVASSSHSSSQLDRRGPHGCQVTYKEYFNPTVFQHIYHS